MPIADPDPRVFFAAERTLLAWLRTGLAIIAIGFVIARFGLFARMISLQTHATLPAQGWSALLGVAFVLVGSLAIVAATVQHGRFIATLPAADLPPRYSRVLAVGMSAAIALLGLVLAVYLLAAN